MSARINLNELTDEQKSTIRKHLYIQPKQTNFGANKFTAVEKDPILFYWIDKTTNEIVLPYSFANSLMKRHINSTLNYPASKYNFTGSLRDYQKDIVKQALAQLQEKGTTTLDLFTGSGKTLCSLYLASQLGGLVLVVTNRETIQTGWVTTLKDNFDAVVWVIDSKMKVPEKCNVILTMDGKLEKIPWEIRKMVSVYIIDEMHLMTTSSRVPVLLGVQPKFIIGCSATLERTDGLEVMAFAMLGTHKVELKNNKKFTVYKLNTGIVTELVKNKQGTTDFAALTRALSFDPKRNAIIVDIVLQNKQSKFMILTWNKEHVTFLTNIFKEKGESVDMLAGSKSTYVDSRILIGTMSKISTGFDAQNVAIDWKNICIDTLILTGSTKSHNMHIQSIGRVFRASAPTIIELVDDNRVVKSHWRERKKNYMEMNCEIKEFNLTAAVAEPNVQEMHAARVKALQEKMQVKNI